MKPCHPDTHLRYAASDRDTCPICGIDLFGSRTELAEIRAAQRATACVNACHGLALPPGIPAGAVAALVAFARMVEKTAPETAGMLGMFRREARAALAPFTTDPAPVSPPVCPNCQSPDLEDWTSQETATHGEGEMHCNRCNREFRFDLPEPVTP